MFHGFSWIASDIQDLFYLEGMLPVARKSLPGLGSLAPNLRLSKSEGIDVTVTPRGGES